MSMPSYDIRPLTPTHREIAPPSHRRWVTDKEDATANLQRQVAKWVGALEDAKELFDKNVHSNPDVSTFDLRQHRGYIFHLLGVGEGLAIDFLALAQGTGEQEPANANVGLIDQNLMELLKELHAWHGTLLDQDDVPESFKQAATELEADNLVEFTPPS